MKLYCFGESGNAYKCALALTLSDTDWEPVFVDFFKGEARSPEFREINVMGEVPVLVDGDTTLSQSGVILDYISSKTGKLGGRSAAERREVLRWLFWDNHKLSTTIGTCRFLMNFLPPDKRPVGVVLPLDALFGFEAPSWRLVAFSVVLVFAYALATELTKRVFYSRRREGRVRRVR